MATVTGSKRNKVLVVDTVNTGQGANELYAMNQNVRTSDNVTFNNVTIAGSISGYATESYVGNQITALVDSSPATMDTLNELAAALGDDPNFATTVSTSIGTKWTQDNTKISQWNTAYTYSQVGHVELDGTSTISGSSASNGTRTAMVWMRGKVGDSVNQINVQGASIEFGQGGTLDTTPAFKFSHQGVLTATGRLNASGGNSDEWNTAYGWGNHASAGYAPIASPSFTGTLSLGSFFSVSNTATVNLTNVLAGSGSAASPAYSFGSDQNTGIYKPTTDTLAVTTAGSEKMRINSSGNVGIGTISPSGKLDVELGSDGIIAEFRGGDSDIFQVKGASNTIALDTRNTAALTYQMQGAERMRLFANGNLSIGTTSSLGKLTVSNSGAEGIEFFPANFTNGNTIQHYNRSGAAYLTSKTIALDHRFDISGTEAMCIDSSGRVGIGTTAPAAKLQVEALGIDTTVTSTTATTQVAIDSMVAATFRSARYTIQITNSTDGTYHLTEMLLIHNGTTPSINEFGTIYTGSAAEAVFTADINSGNVRILATPASTDAMAFKVVRHSITV